jgi:thioredoxin
MGVRAAPAGDKVATVEVTQENFNQVVNGNSMVIVDFWAPWCGPCRSFAPAYEAASEKHPDVVFAKVNTEEQQALAGYFQIRSIPTLMVFRDKIIIFAQPGALPASALEQVIEKAKALDMDEVRREIAAEQKQAPAG